MCVFLIIAYKIHPTCKLHSRKIILNVGLRESMLPTRFKVEIFRDYVPQTRPNQFFVVSFFSFQKKLPKGSPKHCGIEVSN